MPRTRKPPPPAPATDSPPTLRGPLTRGDLDQIQCDSCGGNHPIVMHSRCHPESPSWVSYDRATGTLLVECAACAETVAVVAVETRMQ